MILLFFYKEHIKRLLDSVFDNRSDRSVAMSIQTPELQPQHTYQDGMRPIESEAELGNIVAGGSGVILNEPPSSSGGVPNRTLHAVGCRTLRNANLSTPKLFGENTSASVEWLRANRGAEDSAWRRCGICKP